MKRSIFRCKNRLISVLVFGVVFFLLLLILWPRKSTYYTKEDEIANGKLYDECVSKAVVTMAYMNGVQLSALHTVGETYVLYCGISALKTHWINADDWVLRTAVCDSMRVYFADIKPYFLQDCYIRLTENQMTALMVLCARIGAGNFSSRMRRLQDESNDEAVITAIKPKAIVREFFVRKPSDNQEVRQYFWVLSQLFLDKIKVSDLYNYPMMSYRYLDETKLYEKNGRPNSQPNILDRYKHVPGRSVSEEGIIPFSLRGTI